MEIVFLTLGSMHHDSMLIKRSNLTQLHADIYSLQSYYMFRASQHPSSGVLKTVTVTSGVGHNIGTAASFHRGLIRSRWKEAVVPIL